jgi:cysteinyl-tRNA synthetase
MKLYNTMSRRKEDFVPLSPGEIKMYSCGPTVYNYFHIGNARAFIIFDILRRYFEYRGNKVTFVQNFTDVDDKIIKRAKDEGVSEKEISDRFIAEYFKDAEALNIRKATYHPKVTEHIPEIIDIIKRLESKDLIYMLNGDVYYDTASFELYGRLGKQNLEELEAGARVELAEGKRSVNDFVLWKKQKPGEPAWESPWGLGRPGWHIECSAMSMKYLGETIDIHSGGLDLIFPHHENEIAQSEGATGKEFARYWLHNGFLNVNNQKMSKSLNNFFTVRDIGQHFDLEVLRMFLLSAHYRSPINFSDDLLEQTQNGLERLYNAKNNLTYLLSNTAEKELSSEEKELQGRLAGYKNKFIEAMDDDLNTADALAAMYDLVRDVNGSLKPESSKGAVQASCDMLMELAAVLGLLQKQEESLDSEIEALIEERQKARKEKNWALSDKIRDDLKARGILLEDTPQGVKWKRA